MRVGSGMMGVGVGVGRGVGVGVGRGVGVAPGADTVIVTVAVFDDVIPSEASYVKVRVNVKLPFELRCRDPLPPPSTRMAVRLSPSASLSSPRTPGAGTLRVTAVVA